MDRARDEFARLTRRELLYILRNTRMEFSLSTYVEMTQYYRGLAQGAVRLAFNIRAIDLNEYKQVSNYILLWGRKHLKR